MNTYSVFDRRKANLAAAFTLLLALVAPAALPSFASADVVTDRSIALSNSAAGASDVSYDVSFTSVGTAVAYVIDFCSNSALIDTECTAPVGFDTTAVSTPDTPATVESLAANTVKVVQTVGASSPISIELENIENPDTAGTLYARIVTYAAESGADGYVDDNPGTYVDYGSVAVSITNEIGVSAAVLETMTFCVASVDITANCANAAANTPSVKLGVTNGDVTALSPTVVSEGSVYTQISTNAAGGAVVNLKSDAANCGGLKRAGAPTACDIEAAGANFVAGEAKFGAKLATVGTDAGTGDFEAVDASGYNASTWFINFVNGNTSGVTSTYGDPMLDTNGAPASNKEMEVKFGASISNNTPAGSYSAKLSMIATGKF